MTTDKTAPERDEVAVIVDFLHGAGPNAYGDWFDDAAEKERGAFWWRKYMRQIERIIAKHEEAARDHANALVAAELAGAADSIQKAALDTEFGHYLVEVCIRSRTPEDAQAALQSQIAAAEARGSQRGIEDAANYVSGCQPENDIWQHPNPHLIRALAQKDQTNDH